MTPSHQILTGDCLELLRQMPDESVQCCVTSPPYFGLRDYGMAAQIGLEDTPAQFVARLTEVFREVRRVLRRDGTAWVNMGDSYAGSWGAEGRTTNHGNTGYNSHMQHSSIVNHPKRARKTTSDPRGHGLKHKDMMGIPWRLAFALQDDGWYLRQDIIWHKPNPMPESTRDRCTKAHEYIFLLSKSRRYHCDMKAIREPAVGGQSEAASQFSRGGLSADMVLPGQRASQHRAGRDRAPTADTRNKRSVWTVATAGYQGAHFATFPPELIRPCILAGAPRGGLVLDPFGGAGTTSLVSMQEGRRSVICELNPKYAALARARIDAAWLDGAAQMDVFQDGVAF
jgi:DNA modification methylase